MFEETNIHEIQRCPEYKCAEGSSAMGHSEQFLDVCEYPESGNAENDENVDEIYFNIFRRMPYKPRRPGDYRNFKQIRLLPEI